MATVRWQGKAANITQVDTITVANVWAEDDTATLTINGNDVVCTVGSDDSTATVAQLIRDAINASSYAADATTGDYNVGAQEIPEFTDVKAEILSTATNVVRVIAKTPGKPFTLSVTESTAGTGTAAETTLVAATGRHFWDNGDNWTGGSVPTSSDTIVFDSGNVSCKYGLPTAATNLDPVAVKVGLGFTGHLGLPEINRDNANAAYYEYRALAPVFDDSTDEAGSIDIGGGQGPGSALINLDWIDKDGVTVRVTGTGSAIENVSDYPVNITGSGTTFTIDVSKGHVAIAPRASDAAVLTSILVTNRGNQSSDTRLFVGPGATGTIATFEQLGGEVIQEGTNTITALEMHAGRFDWDAAGGTITTANIFGGTFQAGYGGNITNLNIAGEFIADRSVVTRTVTNAQITRGGLYSDPQRQITLTNGLDVYQCGIGDVEINMGRHFTVTPSAI